MAYAKKKNPRYSRRGLTNVPIYKIANSNQPAKKTILTIIILAAITVVIATFLQFLADPERISKQALEKISADYYENYLYETILSTNSISENSDQTADTSSNSEKLADIMSRYVTSGFAKITLRQLLLYDAEKNPALTATLATYCDENKTYIRIFPDSPFGRKDYHIEYSYSCTF